MMDKLAMYGLVAIALGGLGWLFNHQITARVNAETRATQSELAAELADRERQRMADALVLESSRATVLQVELDAARNTEADATAVLQDRDRLARLTGAKPGLLENRAQAATTRVLQRLSRPDSIRARLM